MKWSGEFTDMMAHLAQGCLNIDEEKHNTFERGSRFHIALMRLMREVNEGRVGEQGKRTVGEIQGKRTLEEALRAEWPEFWDDRAINGADLVEFLSEWLQGDRNCGHRR